jgi:hypothetical protein
MNVATAIAVLFTSVSGQLARFFWLESLALSWLFWLTISESETRTVSA